MSHLHASANFSIATADGQKFHKKATVVDGWNNHLLTILVRKRGIYPLTHVGRKLLYSSWRLTPDIEGPKDHLPDLGFVFAKSFDIPV